VQKEQSERGAQMIGTIASIGTAALGAFFGKKTFSAASASRMGTAARGVGRMQKESGDVARANESVETVRQALAELDQEIETQAGALQGGFDAQAETLETITIKPKAAEVQVHEVGLVWMAS
jgi:hypothetical protein